MQKLMFIIDEGIGGTELLSLYGTDYKKLDVCLKNIYEGLVPLKAKYQVVLLIYPTYHYRVEGYAQPASDPLNRISPQLKHVFEYFDGKGMNVYLEIHSSGIYTNQNGELGDLPLAPLHYGEYSRYKSLPMDMETVKALKDKYGSVFEGLRFHELIGSHEIGLHDREKGKEDKSHAFVVQDEVMRGIIDTVKLNGLQLVWGDHSFNLVEEQPEKFACFKTWLDYAADTLGANHLTLNWANNGWPMHKYITGKFAFKDYRGLKTGMSVQSWFWQESDSSTMTRLKDGKWDVKWYAYAEMECPAELMAMFSLKYFNEGCTLVQYEPSHYIFNFYRPGKKLVEYDGNVESKADYSVRLSAKRMFNMLLNGMNTSIEPKDYYDADKDKFVNNFEGSGAKRYYQNTLGVAYDSAVRYFDVYNCDPSKITENSEYRYLESLTLGNKIITRTHMGYSGIDDILTLKDSGELNIFNMRNGIVFHDNQTLKGKEIYGIVSLNIISEYVNCLDGDADEILAFVKGQTGVEVLAFKVVGEGSELERKFVLKQIDSRSAKGFTSEINSRNLLGIYPLRNRMCVNSDTTRPPDWGTAWLNTDGNSLLISMVIGGKKICKKIECSGTAVAACTVDINCDYCDELAVCVEETNGFYVHFYKIESGEKLKQRIYLGSQKPDFLFSARVGYNQKNFVPVYGNLNNALVD